MRCPFCNECESKVIDSRTTDGNAIRRRRECLTCGQRFTSYERVEIGPVFVIKRDGRTEEFNRDKISIGLAKACEKLPVSADAVNKLTERVIFQIRENFGREVKTTEIGKTILNELKLLDPVAYVRFLSVYRQFTDIEDFFAVLRDLMKEKSSLPVA